MAFPLQHETDMSDPLKRFVWAFQGIELNSHPVAFPIPMLEEISEHLSKAGFVHISQVSECPVGENPLKHLPSQEIHFQPPLQGQEHTFNLSGEWKPVTEPVVLRSEVEEMTSEAKKILIEQFREEGLID